MELTSSAFDANCDIPRRYTCEGLDVAPPLHWSGVPANAAGRKRPENEDPTTAQAGARGRRR